MWLSARLMKTTAYSSKPSGSTLGTRPGTMGLRRDRRGWPVAKVNIRAATSVSWPLGGRCGSRSDSQRNALKVASRHYDV
jgi:hypothetical protein